jgi:hypothetical protein
MRDPRKTRLMSLLLVLASAAAALAIGVGAQTAADRQGGSVYAADASR